MKTIISENKLHDVISKYIDDYLEGNKINWTYGAAYDAENEYSEPEETEHFLIFYNGDWEGDEDSDVIFYYFMLITTIKITNHINHLEINHQF